MQAPRNPYPKLPVSTAHEKGLSIQAISRFIHNLPRALFHNSCQESFYTELVQRSQKEILPRDLYTLQIFLVRGLAKRLLIEICTKILPRGLLQRSCQRNFYRDLVQRSCEETCLRDLVQRSVEESRVLGRGSFIDTLDRDLTLSSLISKDLL